jgi:putative sigma-54 modulation protein
MQIDIRSVHFKTDKKLDDFILEKVNKLSQYFDGIISAEVSLKVANVESNDNKITEVRINIPGNDLYAKKQTGSFEESVDESCEALRKQLIKHKEKLRRI